MTKTACATKSGTDTIVWEYFDLLAQPALQAAFQEDADEEEPFDPDYDDEDDLDEDDGDEDDLDEDEEDEEEEEDDADDL